MPDVYFLVGANDSGKSSTIRALTGARGPIAINWDVTFQNGVHNGQNVVRTGIVFLNSPQEDQNTEAYIQNMLANGPQYDFAILPIQDRHRTRPPAQTVANFLGTFPFAGYNLAGMIGLGFNPTNLLPAGASSATGITQLPARGALNWTSNGIAAQIRVIWPII